MAASWDGRPRLQCALPLLFDLGDGSDGAVTVAANANFSAIAGVAADANGVYTLQCTTFTINDGVTVTLDQPYCLIRATGAVTLGGGVSGAILGTGNGALGGSGDSSARSGSSGIGPGRGNGGGLTYSPGKGGGGAGARAAGTDGGTPGTTAGKGGTQTNWLTHFLTGDTLDILTGAGGGGGGGDGAAAGSAGGKGGAGLYIVAASIRIRVGFTWTSTGAVGGGPPTAHGGGGGGGAGGPVVCAALTIQIDATTGSVLVSLGGAGGAGGGTGTAGGAGSVGHVVLLWQRWYDVGGAKMDATALAARTDPDAQAYQFRSYRGTGTTPAFVVA